MLGKVLGFCAALFLVLSLYWLRFAPPAQSHLPVPIIDGPRAIHAKSDHALRLAPNLFTGGAVSDGRTYSVSLIAANKNKIPTGTELFVQGTMYRPYYGPTDDCTWLLIRGRANVQHGEVDPAYYCRFSIVLTEKGANGQDLWPGVGLMCDTTITEFKEAQHLYHYGEEVQVHGSYAASLDFLIAYLPGGHFGVPVLKNCTFADPTDKVVRPEVSTNTSYKPKTPEPSLASPPKLVSSVEPQYPEEARATKLGGTVTVGMTVDTQGVPQNLQVVKSPGAALDQAALNAVGQYRFEPAHNATGEPVEMRVNVDVNFQIF